jgi:prolyl-tRNA editing enzyme YbaK/EbsC (Cys-tRNA(Pro) deacylase)
VCYRAGDTLDLAALGNELGGVAMEALPEELPDAAVGLEDTVPPLGTFLGLPLVVDEAVESYTTIVFNCFGPNEYVEVPYEDFARQEQPRVASFVRAGELERAGERTASRSP